MLLHFKNNETMSVLTLFEAWEQLKSKTRCWSALHVPSKIQAVAVIKVELACQGMGGARQVKARPGFTHNGKTSDSFHRACMPQLLHYHTFPRALNYPNFQILQKCVKKKGS